jgi:hypothetical protein
MRTLVLALTGLFAVCVVNPASAATVHTKYGSYQGGCSGSSCLYKSGHQKSQKHHMKHQASTSK